MSWNHGYQTNYKYATGYYRELAPAWIDFSSIICGNLPARKSSKDPFNYLELGSGMGFHLCLLALTHPEGNFVGIDFNPDHVLHGKCLADELRIDNIKFIEGDFIDLADGFSEFEGQYNYVVAHGIASWVTHEVREALITLASNSLKLGGLFYCSYNSLPGKQHLSSLQQLALIEFKRNQDFSSSENPHPVIQAAKTLIALQGTQEDPSKFTLCNPQLVNYINSGLEKQDQSYLSGEFLNEGWQPLSVLEVHSTTVSNKLSYVGSATLPENFSNLLPDNIRDLVNAESNDLIREFLKDIAINQGFRRDLFSRGSIELSFNQQYRLIEETCFCLTDAHTQDKYSIPTSFGLVTGNYDFYSSLEKSLLEGPKTFKQLLGYLPTDFPNLAQAISLLIHEGRINFYIEDTKGAVLKRCKLATNYLNKMHKEGLAYRFRPSAYTRSANSFSLAEVILEEMISNNVPESDYMVTLSDNLDKIGISLEDIPSNTIDLYLARRDSLKRQGCFS
jgi:phospholipid N-methyltransferase